MTAPSRDPGRKTRRVTFNHVTLRATLPPPWTATTLSPSSFPARKK